MGTEILHFRPWGAEKIGFKESNPISKNMTKLTFSQAQFSLVVSHPFSGPKCPELTQIIKSGTVHKYTVLREPCGGHFGGNLGPFRAYLGHLEESFIWSCF